MRAFACEPVFVCAGSSVRGRYFILDFNMIFVHIRFGRRETMKELAGGEGNE